MIKFFDWRILRKKDISYIIHVLSSGVFDSGLKDSYIINPHRLITNELNATKEDLYIYLDLASRRNYYEFKCLKNNRLKDYYIKDYDIDKLKMNSLLLLKNNEIYFKYEE